MVDTYLLSLPISAMVKGGRYYNLPLHCTVVQYFIIGRPFDDLREKVDEVCAKACPVALRSKEDRVMFGKNADVPATLVTLVPALRKLHFELIREIEELEGALLNPEGAKLGYRPHVSDVLSQRYSHCCFEARQLAIIRKLDTGQKEIVEQIALGK